MWSFRAWRRRRAIQAARVDERTWTRVWSSLPLLAGFGGDEARQLRELALLLMRQKHFEAARDLVLDDEILYTIALQAALPVLHLGLDWYTGWHAVIVYPGGFVPVHEEMDEAGVVHEVREEKLGESWLHGPLILSWPDAARAGARDGYNLVIHEFAHKLDMQDGAANGLPPLHRGMSVAAWSQALGSAYDDFTRRLDRNEAVAIDPYGGEDPAEFFAVLSETFFETPHILRDTYPAVYAQFAAFYRQDPAQRLTPVDLPLFEPGAWAYDDHGRNRDFDLF